MSNGYWLVTVNRETGESTTEHREDKERAWLDSMEPDNRIFYTTVINANPPGGC